jgi:protoheme IX farnesyltransferase
MVVLAWRVRTETQGARGEKAARNLFAFSILYLFVLFATRLIESAVGSVLAPAMT